VTIDALTKFGTYNFWNLQYLVGTTILSSIGTLVVTVKLLFMLYLFQTKYKTYKEKCVILEPTIYNLQGA
jgi:hypothetical protein